MDRLRPRPARALEALESLQEGERRGVEGDIPWQGHNASVEDAISRQMIADAMEAIPYAHGEPVTDDLLRRWTSHATSPRFDRTEEIRAAEIESSAMGRSPDRWSRYEYPPASTLLQDAAARIEGAIGELEKCQHSRRPRPRKRSSALRALAGDAPWHLADADLPAIGTLLTGQFTAQTLLAEGDALVVVVESGTFALAKGLAQAGIIGANEIFEYGRLSEPTVQVISDIAATLATVGVPLAVNPRTTPVSMEPYVAAVRDCMLMFVLAHEYGHIVHGDLSAHPLGGAIGEDGSDPELEYAADLAGLRITLGANLDSPLPAAGLTSAMLFLAGQDLLDRVDAATNHTVPQSLDPETGLPPYAQRTYKLITEIDSSREMMHAVQDALRLAQTAFHAVLFAWDIVAPAFMDHADELAEISSAAEGQEHLPEFLQLTAMSRLWSHVQPRVADQRPITGL